MWESAPWALLPILHALARVEHELLLFAAFWFVLGACDELTIDLYWLWLWSGVQN